MYIYTSEYVGLYVTVYAAHLRNLTHSLSVQENIHMLTWN